MAHVPCRATGGDGGVRVDGLRVHEQRIGAARLLGDTPLNVAGLPSDGLARHVAEARGVRPRGRPGGGGLSQAVDKKAKILLAALELSGGDLSNSFTAEELRVAAWRKDPMAFGLRGFEREYPAAEVIRREIGKRGPGTQSMVDI